MIKSRISDIEAEASLTHYIHNHKNGVSKKYKKDAVKHVKEVLEYKFPDETIDNTVAEEALQYMIFNHKSSAPFPEPKSEKFKFIDLFAGIGGFRMAFGYNLFVRSIRKEFSFQSLTQKLA